VEPADEIPTAAAVWSRSQFRLRYDSQKRRRSYASGAGSAAGAGTAAAAFYLLLFLLWSLRPESLAMGALLTIAVVVTAAALGLSWMIRRTVGG
jgi:hypothetical protein